MIVWIVIEDRGYQSQFAQSVVGVFVEKERALLFAWRKCFKMWHDYTVLAWCVVENAQVCRYEIAWRSLFLSLGQNEKAWRDIEARLDDDTMYHDALEDLYEFSICHIGGSPLPCYL